MQAHSTTYSGPGRPPIPLTTRFWAKVLKTDGCWLWQSLKNELGYGEIRQAGIGTPKLRAHRVSWEIHYGPIPDGLFVCHHCDQPSCVRPDHLFLGTALDNSRDMISKGRWKPMGPRSENSRTAKLTPSMVQEIRDRFHPYVVGRNQLASEFGVSASTIKDIVTKRTWRNV